MTDPANLPFSLTSLARRERQLNYQADRKFTLARTIGNTRRKLRALENEAQRLGLTHLLQEPTP